MSDATPLCQICESDEPITNSSHIGYHCEACEEILQYMPFTAESANEVREMRRAEDAAWIEERILSPADVEESDDN